jgi:hypothetical protein
MSSRYSIAGRACVTDLHEPRILTQHNIVGVTPTVFSACHLAIDTTAHSHPREAVRAAMSVISTCAAVRRKRRDSVAGKHFPTPNCRLSLSTPSAHPPFRSEITRGRPLI